MHLTKNIFWLFLFFPHTNKMNCRFSSDDRFLIFFWNWEGTSKTMTNKQKNFKKHFWTMLNFEFYLIFCLLKKSDCLTLWMKHCNRNRIFKRNFRYLEATTYSLTPLKGWRLRCFVAKESGFCFFRRNLFIFLWFWEGKILCKKKLKLFFWIEGARDLCCVCFVQVWGDYVVSFKRKQRSKFLRVIFSCESGPLNISIPGFENRSLAP